MPRGLVLVLAVLALVAGCAGANRQVSPLTGMPASSGAPVLAVKVDNSPAGRPWTGVEDADVVYVEPVEGGTTRLLAVFSSRLPASVGPVRSARESDVTVLGAYGRPALAFSGSAPELAGTLAGAPLVAVTPATAAVGVPPRPRPARAGEPLRRPRPPCSPRPGAASPHPVTSASGSARPPAGGEVVRHREVAFGSAIVGLTWDAVRGRWVVEPGGDQVVPTGGGDPVGAATVLVQKVTTRPSAIRDAAGAVSPYAVTTGEGEAEVLRDGRAFPARWSRPTPTDPTRVLDAGGAPVPFASGPLWVLLTPEGG